MHDKTYLLHWDYAARFSMSQSIFLLLVALTVAARNDRSLTFNKLSLLPCYALIGQSFFMCIYYSGFGVYELMANSSSHEDRPASFVIVRSIMGFPQ